MAVRPADWEPKITDPEVLEYIASEVGEDCLPMAKYLQENEPVTGVQILEDHEETKPSDVRKLLYRMMTAHVAEYDKDTDASGWETFTWRLDLMEIKYILRRRWADELAHVRKQLRFEKDHEFYVCVDRHRRMPFEDAMDLGFACPVCTNAMETCTNDEIVTELQARHDELAAALEN